MNGGDEPRRMKQMANEEHAFKVQSSRFQVQGLFVSLFRFSRPEGRLELLRVRTPALRATGGVIWAVGNTPVGRQLSRLPGADYPLDQNHQRWWRGFCGFGSLWREADPAWGGVGAKSPVSCDGRCWKSETWGIRTHQPGPTRSNRIKPNQAKSSQIKPRKL